MYQVGQRGPDPAGAPEHHHPHHHHHHHYRPAEHSEGDPDAEGERDYEVG